jgi:acid phosphatase
MKKLALLAAGVLLVACGGPGQATSSSTPSPGPRPRVAPVSKLLVFVVENHSLDQMQTDMPATFALAQEYGYASHYQGVTHPSLPNYLTMVSGDAHGVTDDGPPSAHPLSGSTVLGRAIAAGSTAALYADGMPKACATENSGSYVVKHNPWAYFTDERDVCEQFDLPISSFDDDVSAGDLPDVGMVIPDLCHDAHDCSLGTADGWLAERLHTVTTGSDWRSGRLAVVITADEDDDHSVPDSDNRVLTVVLHGSQHHDVVTTPLDHHSLYALLEDVAGLPHQGSETSGTSMAKAFGLPLGG